MTNILTVTIAGSSVSIREGSFKLTQRVNDKDTCNFTVLDATGLLTFNKGQTVIVSDSVLGTLFQGFVNKPTSTNLYPNVANEWSIDCVNQFYVPAKETTISQTGTKKHRGGKHVNQYAGSIVANQIQEYLEPDGISGNFGLDWSELQTDWETGILTNTVAATNATVGNPGGGNLELAAAGTPFSYSSEAATSATGNILQMVGYAISGYSGPYHFRQIWSGSQSVSTSDVFQYDVWISSDSPQIKAAVDFICSDSTTLRDSGAIDQEGLSPHPTTDLSGLANDTWYTRSFNMPSGLNGKTIVSVMLAFAGTASGTYTAYFRKINYLHGAATLTIFGLTSTLSTNNVVSNNGYSNVAVTQTTGGEKIQQVTLSPGNFSTVGITKNSQIAWTETLPSGVSVLVETSLDAGASWQAASNGGSIAHLLAGMSPGAGAYLNVRATFTLGKDPTVNASLNPLKIIIDAAYAATKSDLLKTYLLPTDFNTGTFTNTINALTGKGITLNGQQVDDWANSGLGWILFGTGSPAIGFSDRQITVSASASADARLRLDGLGQWQNFTLEVDVLVSSVAGDNVGIVYRCTGWQNNNDTYAYSVFLQLTQVVLGHGTNSSSGAGSFTSIIAASASFAANSSHRLKIVVAGSSHTIYVDGVQYISTTDTTYSAAGYIGLRVYNSAGSGTFTQPFGLFGVVAALSGTWQSPSINISSPGTYGNSMIQWDTDNIPDNTCSITVQSSVDGGSTFQSVTNGGAISGLTGSQALSGKTLILLVTMTISNATSFLAMTGITAWIIGQYSSSGNRSTAPLAWDNMIRANVTGGFGTATNGMTYTKTGTGTVALTGNEATISNTTGDVHMHLGSVTQGDTNATCRFSLSASTITAGVELRYNDVNDFYRLAISTTTVSLVKVSGGVAITLASVSITVSTSVFYWLRFIVQGDGSSAPVSLSGKVWLDGSLEPTIYTITATD